MMKLESAPNETKAKAHDSHRNKHCAFCPYTPGPWLPIHDRANTRCTRCEGAYGMLSYRVVRGEGQITRDGGSFHPSCRAVLPSLMFAKAAGGIAASNAAHDVDSGEQALPGAGKYSMLPGGNEGVCVPIGVGRRVWSVPRCAQVVRCA